MGDVSKKLMNQFATNLNTMLDQQPSAAAPRPASTRTKPTRTQKRQMTGPSIAPARERIQQRRTKADATATDGWRATTLRPLAARRAQDQRTGRCPDRVVRRRRLGDPQACPPARWRPCAAVDRACGGSPDADDVSDDVAAVRELIGRTPRGSFDVVVRDDAGDAGRAIATHHCSMMASRCRPVTGWSANARSWPSSRLESHGRGASRRIRDRSRRWSPMRMPATRPSAMPHSGRSRRPRPHGGVGGTRTGVKCLHAHYAWFLAGGDDPVGAWVAHELARRSRQHGRRERGDDPAGDDDTLVDVDGQHHVIPLGAASLQQQRVRLRPAAAGRAHQRDRLGRRSPRRHASRAARAPLAARGGRSSSATWPQ